MKRLLFYFVLTVFVFGTKSYASNKKAAKADADRQVACATTPAPLDIQGDWHSVKISDACIAEITLGDVCSCHVDSSRLVNVWVEGNTLHAESKKENTTRRSKSFSRHSDKGGHQPIIVQIVMPALNSLEVDDASRATLQGYFNILSMKVSDASRVETKDCEIRELTVKGASHATLQGHIDTIAMYISDASRVEAMECTIENVVIKCSGASTANVNAVGSIKAETSDVSSIVYMGDPSKLHIESMSNRSSIRQVDADQQVASATIPAPLDIQGDWHSVEISDDCVAEITLGDVCSCHVDNANLVTVWVKDNVLHAESEPENATRRSEVSSRQSAKKGHQPNVHIVMPALNTLKVEDASRATVQGHFNILRMDVSDASRVETTDCEIRELTVDDASCATLRGHIDTIAMYINDASRVRAKECTIEDLTIKCSDGSKAWVKVNGRVRTQTFDNSKIFFKEDPIKLRDILSDL